VCADVCTILYIILGYSDALVCKGNLECNILVDYYHEEISVKIINN
jgi:hypothetical protein